MAMKKCRSCTQEIIEEAMICPYCLTYTKKFKRTVMFFVALCCLFAFLLYLFRGNIAEFFASKPTEVSCQDETMAYVMSQKYVKRFLKAPSSASFPYISSQGVSSIYLGNCKHKVSAYVESKNGFGVMLRNYYTVIMLNHKDKKTWSGSDLKMEQE